MTGVGEIAKADLPNRVLAYPRCVKTCICTLEPSGGHRQTTPTEFLRLAPPGELSAAPAQLSAATWAAILNDGNGPMGKSGRVCSKLCR